MRPRLHAILAIFIAQIAAPISAKDALCDQLDKFVRDQKSETTDPLPRHWVEFHWGVDSDPNSIWSWGCWHSEDQSSKEFCAWLMDNTSREFRSKLPINVQQCMGYRFPRQAW